MLAECEAALAEQFDPQFGGFGFDPDFAKKPKFPEPSNLAFLLDRIQNLGKESNTLGPLLENGQKKAPDARTMLLVTLDGLARGGIRDHLGGGYHRYSTERTWSVPHFEKMLYDNAQLAAIHVRAYEITKDDRWKQEAASTFAFLERSMMATGGSFSSALDAETKGEEGAYYVWTRAEVESALGKGKEYDLFSKVYGLDREPNFDKDRYVLREDRSRAELAKELATTPDELEKRLAPLRKKLLTAREKRPAPRLDDKVLTSWNGLAMAAFADGFRVFKNPRYADCAERIADYLLRSHRDSNGRLLHVSTPRERGGKGAAYLDDYAFLVYGLLHLHTATSDVRWLNEARSVTDRMLAEFSDPDGGFFFTADGHESLLARMKDPFDNALPSANSVAIRNLVALGELTREPKYLDAAEQALNAFSPLLARMPHGAPFMLIGLREHLDAREVTNRPDFAAREADDAKSLLSAEAVLDRNAKIAPGAEIDVTIRLKIADGWHIAANPSGSQTVKPTEVSLPPAHRS